MFSPYGEPCHALAAFADCRATGRTSIAGGTRQPGFPLATHSNFGQAALLIGRRQMADDLKSVGKTDRIRASLQKHEVQYIANKFKITGQAAAGAVRAAGPMREKVYAYIKSKKKGGR
jgi:hypothetical protein